MNCTSDILTEETIRLFLFFCFFYLLEKYASIAYSILIYFSCDLL